MVKFHLFLANHITNGWSCSDEREIKKHRGLTMTVMHALCYAVISVFLGL